MTIKEKYFKWLKDTGRAGGVLMGSSVREFLDIIEPEKKYANGMHYDHIEPGANGVIKSFAVWPCQTIGGEKSTSVSYSAILHDANTGKCWRNKGFDIINFKPLKS